MYSEKSHRQMESLYGYMSTIGRENFNPEMKVIVEDGRRNAEYKAGELWKHFVFEKPVEPFNCKNYGDTKTAGYPRLKGYDDPIWVNGAIRYGKTS